MKNYRTAIIVLSAAFLLGFQGHGFGAEYNPTDYGAKPDGETVCTEAIQKAIDACAEAGGGTVVFSPGTYMTGSVFLKDKVDFRVDMKCH